MGQILQVNDLHVYYGSIHAVKGVSFEVNEGEIVTLIGANGAGKSTVLNTVSGLLHPKHGSVVFEGKDLKGVPAHKIVEHGLAQVPEGRHVFLQMTVEDNLEMGAYTQPNSTIEAGIADILYPSAQACTSTIYRPTIFVSSGNTAPRSPLKPKAI